MRHLLFLNILHDQDRHLDLPPSGSELLASSLTVHLVQLHKFYGLETSRRSPYPLSNLYLDIGMQALLLLQSRNEMLLATRSLSSARKI
jgi:hypothetical protein